MMGAGESQLSEGRASRGWTVVLDVYRTMLERGLWSLGTCTCGAGRQWGCVVVVKRVAGGAAGVPSAVKQISVG